MTAEQVVSALLYIVFGITWSSVLIALLVLMMAILFWRLNLDPESKFDVQDLLVSEATGKADLYKTTIATMGALSVGTIIALLVSKEVTAVVTLLPTVLGIFVLGRGAQMIWGKRPDDSQAPTSSTEPPKEQQ